MNEISDADNCLIIAGEKSGEEHCLSFFSDLKKTAPNCSFWGVGGDELEREGVELHYHLKDFSSWGFSEVIGKIPFYIRAFKNIQKEVKKRNCKHAILIDFQDFNLRLAKKLKAQGVNVYYYVAPQAWAWKAGRAKVLENTVHSLFTIIPFEKKWFSDRGVKRVYSVAHPLWVTYQDELKSVVSKAPYSELRKEFKLLLLPGSRNFEVSSLLPEFVKTANLLKKAGHKFSISIVQSSNVKAEHYEPYNSLFDKVYANEELALALKEADLCMAASGTVTLATALFSVPTVVCYKTSYMNEFIFNNFISYDGPISLANIVHEKNIYPELIQKEANPDKIFNELSKWLEDESNYESTIDTLLKTKTLVNGGEFNVGQYIGKEISSDSK